MSGRYWERIELILSSLGGAYGSPLLGLDDDDENNPAIFSLPCLNNICSYRSFKARPVKMRN